MNINWSTECIVRGINCTTKGSHILLQDGDIIFHLCKRCYATGEWDSFKVLAERERVEIQKTCTSAAKCAKEARYVVKGVSSKGKSWKHFMCLQHATPFSLYLTVRTPHGLDVTASLRNLQGKISRGRKMRWSK